MSEFTLYRGNRNYSSWSMRAWLALRATGASFREIPFHLGAPDYAAAIRAESPAGKVPALRHGDLLVWDSLAITEYLAEQFPDAGIWQVDSHTRAGARAVTAEMHSGFPALRAHMPFNVRRSSPGEARGTDVERDVERVMEIWRTCRKTADGPFLFGDWCAADMFFAPVVSRFRSFGVELDQVSGDYALSVWEHADVAEWIAGAQTESETVPHYDG
ncbi:MAG: glutathione S-transferase [Acidobacteria bacterium]|nr:glutathione S-transferase [Acidobacteriota bacterium]